MVPRGYEVVTQLGRTTITLTVDDSGGWLMFADECVAERRTFLEEEEQEERRRRRGGQNMLTARC
jgi:hypothetical protein